MDLNTIIKTVFLHKYKLNDKTLQKVLIYKKFDDEIITLTSNPVIVYTGSNNQGIVSFKN